MPDLSGQVAVITGAAGRLGQVWTVALTEAGVRVLVVDLRERLTREFLDEFYPRCGASAYYAAADVTDANDVAALLDECQTWFGVPQPTILVNAAGVDAPPGADTRRSDILSVNVVGVDNCLRWIGSGMAHAGRGSIINIGSLYGSVAPDPALYAHLDWHKPPAYGASKAAVHALTRHYAALWGHRGVRVNTLSPGGVRGGQDATFVAEYERRVPLGRMAEPEDLTGPLLFLASDASRYVTGQELIVDGGYTCL